MHIIEIAEWDWCAYTARRQPGTVRTKVLLGRAAPVIPALGHWMIDFTDTDRLRRVGMGFAIFGLLVVHDEKNSGNISFCGRDSYRESVI